VALLAALLEKLCDQSGPACLMAGAYAGTVVAMEVFVEGNEIAPVRISLEFCCTAKDCPSLIAVFQKDA
jgi:hypothetical protein